MSAKVTAYSANPWDTTLTLKWECLGCGCEGGWASDRRGAFEQVQKLADAHNAAVHKEVTA